MYASSDIMQSWGTQIWNGFITRYSPACFLFDTVAAPALSRGEIYHPPGAKVGAVTSGEESVWTRSPAGEAGPLLIIEHERQFITAVSVFFRRILTARSVSVSEGVCASLTGAQRSVSATHTQENTTLHEGSSFRS